MTHVLGPFLPVASELVNNTRHTGIGQNCSNGVVGHPFVECLRIDFAIPKQPLIAPFRGTGIQFAAALLFSRFCCVVFFFLFLVRELLEVRAHQFRKFMYEVREVFVGPVFFHGCGGILLDFGHCIHDLGIL